MSKFFYHLQIWKLDFFKTYYLILVRFVIIKLSKLISFKKKRLGREFDYEIGTKYKEFSKKNKYFVFRKYKTLLTKFLDK